MPSRSNEKERSELKGRFGGIVDIYWRPGSVRETMSELNLSDVLSHIRSSIGGGSAKLASGSALALHDRSLLHRAVKLTQTNS